jgi:LuxR family maltose regulon positive regulatory protein
VSPEIVPRPRLIERLNASFYRHKLALISAPAGFGKTTLLGEWIFRRGGVIPPSGIIPPSWSKSTWPLQFAWLSLDEGDNDPARFLTYLIAALQTIHESIGETILAALQSPQPPPIEGHLVTLLNEIAALPAPIVLVLDDYHVIRAQEIHDALSYLLDHLLAPPGRGAPRSGGMSPPGRMPVSGSLLLVIATRADPPLPIPRLRSRGQLTELYQSDLRFTPKETAGFLNEVMGLGLSPEDVSALEQRTEGWVAGLQMAALSMRGRNDVAGFVQAFTGSHRYILDYLSEEVLQQQPEDVREFLLRTSILDRLCGDLCDAMFGEDVPVGVDSQSVLESLEKNNLFIVPLDDERRWYRYHHLFADLLRRTLEQRRSAEQIRELHRRASRWHQGEGSLEEAMIHAMASRDFERAASMIEENLVRMFDRSEVPVLLGWIEKLPEPLVRSRPWIDVYRATTMALASRLDGIDPLLEDVEKRVALGAPVTSGVPGDRKLLGHIAAVRAFVANLRGDAARVVEMAALTKEYLPMENATARGMASYALADTCFADDDLEGARQALLDMLRAGEETGQLMLIVPALCDLAAANAVQGRLYQAESLYGRAYQWMAEQKGLDSRVRCSYEFGIADLLREWNQLDAAYEHVMIGVEVRRRLGGYHVSGDLPLMRILQARGDVEGALGVLHDVEQVVQAYPFPLAATIQFKTARVLQWLAAGDLETAGRWAAECDGGSELEGIALARLRLAQGRAADAQSLLERQGERAQAGGRSGRLIEILAVQALAMEALGRPNEAQATLSQSLSLAGPEGYVRVFLDLGWPLYELLRRLVALDEKAGAYGAPPVRARAGYVRDLLDAFQHAPAAQKGRNTEPAPRQPAPAKALVDPLTERELDVLKLLAQGLSNKAIADRLVVAPSTIKQHLKNIYGKFDVHSRTQAVARGRELGLL